MRSSRLRLLGVFKNTVHPCSELIFSRRRVSRTSWNSDKTVRFIRMRKQIHDRNTAINRWVGSDIRSDLSDQEAEGCYVMPYKIYGVPTHRAY
jgi:hypothetical protein